MPTIRLADADDVAFLGARDHHVSADELVAVVGRGRVLLLVDESAAEPLGWLRWGLFWDMVPFMNMLHVVARPSRGQGLGRLLVEDWECRASRRRLRAGADVDACPTSGPSTSTGTSAMWTRERSSCPTRLPRSVPQAARLTAPPARGRKPPNCRSDGRSDVWGPVRTPARASDPGSRAVCGPDFVHRSPHRGVETWREAQRTAIMDIEAARSSARGPIHVRTGSTAGPPAPRSRRRGACERRDSRAVRPRVRPRTRVARAAQRRRVRRVRDPGARGPRGGPQASGHVHRLDRRARSAPPDLGDRQQRRRRVAGRLLRPRRA